MFQDLTNLLFPDCCSVCQIPLVKNEQWVCTSCFINLPQTNYHLEIDNPVIQKFYGRVSIMYAMALYKFRPGNGVQRLVHQLKYNNKPDLGIMLGRMYGSFLAKKAWVNKFDCIIPVPLHPKRLKERGYNQSDYFAKGISELLEIPWYGNSLQLIKHTHTQTQMGRVERLNNLKEAFCVIDPCFVHGKHILLVDDVITTGATLESCALSLLENGAKQVSIAAIGVAD
jgi:ComF family protein